MKWKVPSEGETRQNANGPPNLPGLARLLLLTSSFLDPDNFWIATIRRRPNTTISLLVQVAKNTLRGFYRHPPSHLVTRRPTIKAGMRDKPTCALTRMRRTLLMSQLSGGENETNCCSNNSVVLDDN